MLAMISLFEVSGQTYTYTTENQWESYDNFNNVFLDRTKNIYRDHSSRKVAVDRWNGAAAIWCQAIYADMVLNAYRRADSVGDIKRKSTYRVLFNKIYKGEKMQYCNFDFHDCNTNTGWFVYDDIMWWTCFFARAYQTFGTKEYLTNAETSFCRVWYGSSRVGDDGSYADPERGLGGGMFWEWQPIDKPQPHKSGDFRSACINFPTVIAACLLHQSVPEGRKVPTAERPTSQTKEWYLEKAKEIFEWADKTLVSSGRVADGIHGAGPEFKDHLYNQATYIGAACHLYLITGDRTYYNKAVTAANYVFMKMCKNRYLPLETGPEQGIYAAIFAQYLHMLVYDCGATRFLTYVRRNLQHAWDNQDKTRGIHDANFGEKTPEQAEIESYAASGLPALMLMFPADDTTPVEEISEDATQADNGKVYGLDGQLVSLRADGDVFSHLPRGIYVSGKRKVMVK